MTSNGMTGIESTLSSRQLELIVLPTEQCNFRCTYCYEDFSIGEMPAEVLSALKNLLLRRISDIRYFSLQWFGGEPLAAKRILYDFSAFAQALCRSRGVGFHGALTTNGYQLDIQTATQLVELGQTKYQISLDGFGAGHDETRRLASGAGTFKRIWANLRALRDSNLPVSVLLRLHLTPSNLESCRELARHLRADFLHDPRFSILLKPIENLGGPNSGEIQSLHGVDRKSAVDEMRDLLGLNGPTSARTAPRADVCYASRPNSFVIRADGRVQKCTVALSEQHNTVGRLLEDGSIHLDREIMGQWMRGYASENPTELHCPAQNFPRPKHSRVISIAAAA